MKTKILICGLSLTFTGLACAGLFGNDQSPDEQRKQIQAERLDILEKVFKEHPELKRKVSSAPGYATFSAVNMNLLIVFNEHKALQEFVNSGWQVGAQADASLKSGEKGAAVGESASVAAPSASGDIDTSMSSGLGEVTQAATAMEVYRITEA